MTIDTSEFAVPLPAPDEITVLGQILAEIARSGKEIKLRHVRSTVDGQGRWHVDIRVLPTVWASASAHTLAVAWDQVRHHA